MGAMNEVAWTLARIEKHALPLTRQHALRSSVLSKSASDRWFVNAMARRVAHVLVVLVLAWCGVGKAHAAESPCPYLNKCSRPDAYAYCKAAEAAARAQTGIPGYASATCSLQGSLRSDGSGIYQCGNWLQGCGAYDPAHATQWSFYACPAGQPWDPVTGTCSLACPGGYSEDPWNPGQCLAIDKSLGGNTCGVLCGNPINVAVGNKYQREDDLKLSSLLYFSRHYNSHPTARSGLLGPHWTHSYSRAVESLTDPSGVQVANIGRPDGRRLRFSYSAGQWTADSDVAATLVRRDSPTGELLGWTFTPQDGHEVEEYDARGRLLQISNANGQAVVLSYNYGTNDFRLTRVQAQDGRSLVLEYDTSRRISKITDSSGSTYVYGYDGAGNLASVTYPGGKSRTYAYNESAYTSGANLPTALTGIVHEDTQRFATFTYATNGKALSTEHAGGVEKVVVQYNADGSASVTESLGQVQQRAFSTVLGVKKAKSIVESCTGCATRSSSYTYDVNGYPDVVTDARGTTTDFNYNSRGLVGQRIDSVNDAGGNKRTTQTDWHATFASPAERRTYDAASALVAKQTWTYNTRGQALTSTGVDPVTANTRTTTTTYCEPTDVTAGTCPLLGLVTSVNGPRTDVNDITTYTYYPSDDATCASAPTTCPHRKGDLWMVQDALGNIAETLKYDGAGRVLSAKDANGVVTDFEYHPRGWLTARKVRSADNASEADDQITRIDYYPAGLVQKTTLPDGSYTSYTYDAAHRLTDITDGEGNKIHYTLDNAGNRTKEDTLGTTGTVLRTLSRVYNQLGQLQTHKDAYEHGTGYVYDANGNTDTVTDALSRVTDNDYDPLNRLTKTIQDVGGLNVTTQFKYDAQDHLTEVTDPKSLSTKYRYNGLGDLLELDSPDTGVTGYTYDSAGNRKTQTDARNVTATYGYDALNRLVSVSYPDSSLNVGYRYDTAATACATGETFAAGRLSQITDGSGSTQYCYDRFGQMVRKVQTTAGQSLTVRYGYTKAGQLSGVTYPDGTVADYVRDGLGRTTQVGVTRPGGSRQVLLTSASYYPFGPASEWVFGNGRLFQRTLNQNYQPGVVQDQSAGGLSLGYEFDAVGNLVKLRNGNQSEPPLRRYAYDALNRLSETHDGTTDALLQGYGYDATGNRTSATDGGVNTAYTLAASSHRLTDVGGVARAYDSAGNTTSIGGAAREFVYSDANRMSAVKQGGNTAMGYAYNGKGEQVLRANGSTSTLAVYDEAGHWLSEYDAAGAPKQQVVWLENLPVGLVIGPAAANQTLHYIEADALGSPRVVFDAQRDAAVWAWPLVGEAFGNDAPAEDLDGDGTGLAFNLRFPGQRYDAATQLNYNYFRDYDPGVGRYAESDPIGLGGGISTYAYVGGNPLSLVDPSGLIAYVCKKGDSIGIVVPYNIIRYNGVTVEDVARMVRLASERWSGRIGRYTVKTQVMTMDGLKVPGWNDGLWLLPGYSGDADENHWYTHQAYDYIYGHEVGHKMGFSNFRNASSKELMYEYAEPGDRRPTEANINWILDPYNPEIVRVKGCDCE